jgi:hypothetical protein
MLRGQPTRTSQLHLMSGVIPYHASLPLAIPAGLPDGALAPGYAGQWCGCEHQGMQAVGYGLLKHASHPVPSCRHACLLQHQRLLTFAHTRVCVLELNSAYKPLVAYNIPDYSHSSILLPCPASCFRYPPQGVRRWAASC